MSYKKECQEKNLPALRDYFGHVPNTKRAALASIKAVISGFSALNDTQG
jgi:hypothetical protein